MKKFILILLLLFSFNNVYASSIVMDMDTNRVLYEDDSYQEKLIASTTKIMTSMVVINHANLDDVIKVDQDVLKSYGSGIYIEIGEEIKVEDLLYGLLMRSGNDAAIVLANYVGGSTEGFVLLMNELASSIGMNNTYFENPSGLDDNGTKNISTCYDMALLMSYAMKNDTFKTIVGTKHKIVKTNYKTYEWYNKNKLLNMYKYATGGKTGYTLNAYRTLVTSASKDNKNLTVVTLGERDDFNIHKNLYEEYFKKYKLVNIIDSKTFLKDENLYVEKNFDMLLRDDEINNVDIKVTYTNDAIDRIGYVTVCLDNKEYFKENIYHIKESKEELNFFQKMKLFYKELFKV